MRSRDVAGGYSNLEFDLETGERGSRYDRLGGLLRAATGAEASLVVNNGAAALLLILDTFARGREAIVARNALIEIGGGFRLPDVLARSGATLIEVGATNKVYAARFRARALARTPGSSCALTPRTIASAGSSPTSPPAELAALGRGAGVLVVEDLGTGALFDLRPYGLPHERTVREAIADGMDLVAVLGRQTARRSAGRHHRRHAGRDRALAREPALARAARRQGDARGAGRDAAPARRSRPRASASRSTACWRALGRRVARTRARAAAAVSGAGGGRHARRLPAAARCRSIRSPRPAWRSCRPAAQRPALARLRAAAPPLVARIDDGRVVIDLRTIDPADDVRVAGALAVVVRRELMRVVGTAGHVDHGKSALVRALTGTEPDRWEEERRRGMTLDLGFKKNKRICKLIFSKIAKALNERGGWQCERISRAAQRARNSLTLTGPASA